MLIQNKNIEIFSKIFQTLTIKYNFRPETINVDCYNEEVISIKKIFTNITIVICHYHLIKNLFNIFLK